MILLIILVGFTGCTENASYSLPERTNAQLRIITNGDGFFQVTKTECEKSGFIWDEDEIVLFHQGDSYPYWIDRDPNTGIEYLRFFSTENPPNINLRDNVFVLSNDTKNAHRRLGPIMIEPQMNKDSTISAGKYTISLELQNLYLPQVRNEDHWLWTLLEPDQPFGGEFMLSSSSIDHMIIRFQVWNPAEVNTINNQIFLVSINDQEFRLDRNVTSGWQTIEAEIDNVSTNYENEIRIQYNGTLDGVPIKLYLDSIEIEFLSQIELGLASQSFYFEEDPLSVNVLSPGSLLIFDESNTQVGVFSFQKTGQQIITDTNGNHAYWIPEQEINQVINISPIKEIDTQTISGLMDYLIIAPQQFHQSLSSFIEMKENQGFKIDLVSPQAIYDSINSGFPSPNAIKEFIQQTYIQNDEGLKYVLLVGDYSYDNLDYTQFIDYVPSLFIQTTTMGETISDFLYTDLDPDHDPDIAIGRIPASTPDQLEIWIEKARRYGQNIPDQWNNFSVIADGSDSIYQQVAGDFLSIFNAEVKTGLWVEPDRNELDQIFSTPDSLLMYFGHGSIGLWGKDQILSPIKVEQLPQVNNAPLVLSFSCLNGYFIHPEQQSLAESLLFQPHGGAMAVFTFTGQPLVVDQEKMILMVKNNIQNKEIMSMGDLIFESLTESISLLNPNIDIVESSIYFGDPSMPIP